MGAGLRDGKGSKGQLTSGKGLGRMGIRQHDEGTASQVRVFSFPFICNMHLW